MSNPLKKTMVYLGLADEEEVYEEPAPRRESREKQVENKTAPVTPIHRPAVVRQPAPATVSEIVTVHPKQYRDAQMIAENFRASGRVDFQAGLLLPEDADSGEPVEDIVEPAIEKAIEQSATPMVVRHHTDLEPLGGIGAVLRF